MNTRRRLSRNAAQRRGWVVSYVNLARDEHKKRSRQDLVRNSGPVVASLRGRHRKGEGNRGNGGTSARAMRGKGARLPSPAFRASPAPLLVPATQAMLCYVPALYSRREKPPVSWARIDCTSFHECLFFCLVNEVGLVRDSRPQFNSHHVVELVCRSVWTFDPSRESGSEASRQGRDDKTGKLTLHPPLPRKFIN